MRRAIAATVVLSAMITATITAAETDLESYILQARTSGMSEMAGSTILGASSILLGQSSLVFSESEPGGRWWPSYQSNSCPVPGLTPEQEQSRQERMRREREPLMETLKAIADSDQSGFVSAAEASAFRGVFEFGVLAAQVQAHHPGDESALMHAAGVDSSGLRTRQVSFGKLSDLARARGLDLLGTLGYK